MCESELNPSTMGSDTEKRAGRETIKILEGNIDRGTISRARRISMRPFLPEMSDQRRAVTLRRFPLLLGEPRRFLNSDAAFHFRLGTMVSLPLFPTDSREREIGSVSPSGLATLLRDDDESATLAGFVNDSGSASL